MLSLCTHPYTHGHIFEKVVATQAGALVKLTFVVVLRNGEHKAKLISAVTISNQDKIAGSEKFTTVSKSGTHSGSEKVFCIAGATVQVEQDEAIVFPYISCLHTKISNFLLGQRPRAPSFV